MHYFVNDNEEQMELAFSAAVLLEDRDGS